MAFPKVRQLECVSESRTSQLQQRPSLSEQEHWGNWQPSQRATKHSDWLVLPYWQLNYELKYSLHNEITLNPNGILWQFKHIKAIYCIISKLWLVLWCFRNPFMDIMWSLWIHLKSKVSHKVINIFALPVFLRSIHIMHT